MGRQDIADVLRDPTWPKEWPFTPASFSRSDETDDSLFYSEGRICYHIDSFAVSALTKYYDSLPLPPSPAILDFCSSWVSHYPESWTASASRIAMMGMSQEELDKNEASKETAVVDLNKTPVFPYTDASFDVVTCVVSIDYMTRPLEVVREVGRVLRPGGRAVFSFSNRCFPTKAISLWLQTSDVEHCFIVGAYFHYADGMFEPPESVDISPPSFGLTDPMYVVTAVKRI
jgi:SAM-dependent methyltransferase